MGTARQSIIEESDVRILTRVVEKIYKEKRRLNNKWKKRKEEGELHRELIVKSEITLDTT